MSPAAASVSQRADSAHVPERRTCNIAANDPTGAEVHAGLELPPGTDDLHNGRSAAAQAGARLPTNRPEHQRRERRGRWLLHHGSDSQVRLQVAADRLESKHNGTAVRVAKRGGELAGDGGDGRGHGAVSQLARCGEGPMSAETPVGASKRGRRSRLSVPNSVRAPGGGEASVSLGWDTERAPAVAEALLLAACRSAG
jgi:hypothetical protein